MPKVSDAARSANSALAAIWIRRCSEAVPECATSLATAVRLRPGLAKHPVQVVAARCQALRLLCPQQLSFLIATEPRLLTKPAELYQERYEQLHSLVSATQEKNVERATVRLIEVLPRLLIQPLDWLLNRIDKIQAVIPSEPALEIIVRCPYLLRMSADRLARQTDELQMLLGLDEPEIASLVARSPRLLTTKNLATNVRALCKLLPASDVGNLVKRCPQLVLLSPATLRHKQRTATSEAWLSVPAL